jgi:hypothetical protein
LQLNEITKKTTTMDVINVDSSNEEDEDDDMSLFLDEDEDPNNNDASLFPDEAEDPREAEVDAILDRIPAFLCPISYAPFKDPVLCKDGVTYERAEINQWLEDSNISPMTRVNITDTTQYPNFALKNAMKEFVRDSKETQNKLKKSEEAQKKLELAITTTNKMLNAATSNVEKLKSENAIIAEKIQTEADTKWKLAQNNLEMENARLLASYKKATNENKKLVSLNLGLKDKLKEEQAKRKLMVDKMKDMVGENEMATTNPKSKKKAKR